jgi:putative ABC transport system substrate-binding protein
MRPRGGRRCERRRCCARSAAAQPIRASGSPLETSPNDGGAAAASERAYADLVAKNCILPLTDPRPSHILQRHQAGEGFGMKRTRLRRREFVTLLGGFAAWPLAARAQPPAMPVIGFLSSLAAADKRRVLAPFSEGLNDNGFAEGRNVAIEYRFAEARYERLPELASELVRRQVSVIAAISGTPAALAAKAATASLPIVFAIGSDPVLAGLVASLHRPGGNITGATFFTASLGAKRVELMRELMPRARTIALLLHPDNPLGVADATDTATAATAMGLQPRQVAVRNGSEIEVALAALARERCDMVYVGPDPLFLNERSRIVALTARDALPAVYAERDSVRVGGLISYGTSRADAYRQAGVYVGRILRGDRPAELPVVLPSRFELAINLKAARALGLEVPPALLARADEAVE